MDPSLYGKTHIVQILQFFRVPDFFRIFTLFPTLYVCMIYHNYLADGELSPEVEVALRACWEPIIGDEFDVVVSIIDIYFNL